MERKLSSLLISHPKTHIVNFDDLLRLFKKLHHLGSFRLLYKLAALFDEVFRYQLICMEDLAYHETRSLINTCYQLVECLPNTRVAHSLLLALRTPLAQMLGRMDISSEQAAVIGDLLEQIRSGSAEAYYKFEQKVTRKAESEIRANADPAQLFYILAEILKVFEDCTSVEQQLMVP